MPREFLSGRIDLQKLLGHIAQLFFYPAFGPDPLLASQTAQARPKIPSTGIFFHQSRHAGWNIDLVPFCVFNQQILLLYPFDLQGIHSPIKTDAIVFMDHKVSGFKVCQEFARHPLLGHGL